jgi:molecular chaperone HscB
MICWSCEREAGGEPLCGTCAAPQPPDAGADHFAVLGLERRYDLDVGAVEARYKELSRRLHPDRFARADPRARRASLQRTVQLNEAWRTLKDPIKRAEYLLGLGGVHLSSDDGGARAGGVAAPPELLMEILERREQLGEARQSGHDDVVASMGDKMRARADQAMVRVAEGLRGEPTPDKLISAARELVALRYYQRFLDEVAVHEDGVAERDAGAERVANRG